MGRGKFIDKNAHQPISAVYICYWVYARHAGFVREVLKDSERDLILALYTQLYVRFRIDLHADRRI